MYSVFYILYFSGWHGTCTSDKDCKSRHAFCNNTDGDATTKGICQCRSGRQYLSKMCLGKTDVTNVRVLKTH